MPIQTESECCRKIHQNAVDERLSDQLEETVISSLADSFKALADPTRIRMLHNLTNRELCVCDLAEILGMTQSAVSHQLRYLRTLRIVKNRREGNTIFYTCDDAHIAGLLQMGIDHASHITAGREGHFNG